VKKVPVAEHILFAVLVHGGRRGHGDPALSGGGASAACVIPEIFRIEKAHATGKDSFPQRETGVGVAGGGGDGDGDGLHRGQS
jgi:hypothetical protein